MTDGTTSAKGLAFIGAGAMAEALVRGVLAAGLYRPSSVWLYDVLPERVKALSSDCGTQAAESAAEAASNADLIVLAVKPQHMDAALESVREHVRKEQLVVSIAAGVRLGQIEAVFGHGQPVVRAMPNTPALIGEGAAALCAGRWADAGHMAAAQALLDAVGVTVQVEDERLLDVVTGLSGSGPAFIFLANAALADGAVAEGLDRATAQRLAAQTVLGAAKLVLESEEHPARLRDRVTSPGGTTAAGLEVLEERAVRSALAAAVRSAARRARELAQQD